MKSKEFLGCLEDALTACRFSDVQELVDKIEPAAFDEGEVKKALSLIRRKRRFADLERAASVFVASGIESPLIRRQWAQALIDQDRVDQALNILRVLDDQIGEDHAEKPEIRGLIGRVHKQRYINEGGEQHLQLAIDAYCQGWKAGRGDYRWHGVNLVALLKRAERDGASPCNDESADAVASTILSEIEDLDEQLTVWDYGTAMEASVALGDKKGALKWAKEYVRHPRADAFELGSALRQLQEVWQIGGSEIGQALEPVIEYEVLQREGGSVSVSADAVTDTSGFQAVYGPESYVRVQWLESMFKVLESVARVRHRTTGEPCGTGFLVNGSSLCETWGDEPVFVTNAHVVSDCTEDESALKPEDACAEFSRLDGRPQIELGEKLCHSKRTALDAWICRVQTPKGAAPLELSLHRPLPPKANDRPQRVYVIGHPKGGELVVSLYNNDLVGYEDSYVHYTSPTEGGSSGSPVLNRELKTFALHHKARRKLEVNEGVLFEQIVGACNVPA